MIVQLLDLTRIRMGTGLSLAPTHMDLGELAQQIAEETRAAHACAIRVEGLGDLAGQWDVDRLGQVLANLLGNAAAHGKEGGTIIARIDGNDANTVLLQIRSEGEIAADLLSVIFEPFRGTEYRRATGRGLGLGLYITRTIVEAHSGIITVRCEDGSTTFQIELPRVTRKLASPSLSGGTRGGAAVVGLT